ncbi:MFS transporter [Sphingobium sp. HWE2-09]|uniref:MFS transporter n=1 Tax=Sphingobium sp. HWE2-09 TaxID=3108390 RepID=UPI002DCF54A1|nr:MFS transporter [Sphingobium sp. HWE2-09]
MDFAVEPPLSRPASTYGEFRRGWQVVLASLLGIGLGLSPMPFYTIGVFAPHLAQEFGWSMGQIMGGISVMTLMVLWAGPAVGLLAGRVGVRPVAMASLVLFGLSFMSLGLSTGSLVQYYTSWAMIAVLGAGTLPITWTKAVNHWFDRRKGLALGLSLMGTGLFGMFSKSYVGWLIESFGWRAAYVGLGLLPLLIALPTAYFLFRDTDTHPSAVVRTTTPGGLTVRQAFRDWRFWLLAVALMPISFALGGPVPNMEVILTSKGIAVDTVLMLTPIIGLSALIGRIAGGWLLDRFWAPAVAFVILAVPGLSCWLLTIDGIGFGTAALAIFLIGFALGIEYDVMAFFVARYFGLRSYAAIYGILYVFFAMGSGFGPLGFGWDYDAHGSYDLALKASFVMLLIAAASFLLLGRYRVFPDEPMKG